MIIKETNNIKVTADKQKQTYSIKIKHINGSSVTYKTPRLSNYDYHSNLDNTYHDWLNYLRSYEYYRILK